MISRLKVAVIFLLAFGSSVAAQTPQTRTQLQTYNNSFIVNGVIPSQLNTLLGNMITSICGPLDTQCISLNTPQSWGAACDGVTDDTTALTHWAASIVANMNITGSGNCIFKSPIAFPIVDRVTISGLTLTYAGATTTGTVLQFGNTNAFCSIREWNLIGDRFLSNTTMTGGDSILIKDICDSKLINVTFGGEFGAGTGFFWNPLVVLGANSLYLSSVIISGNNDCATIAGDTNAGGSALALDVFFNSALIVNCPGVGLRIGGGASVSANLTDILANGTEVQIDQSRESQYNGVIFFGSSVTIDKTVGGAGIGVNVVDPGSPLNSQIFFDGAWLASAINQCLYVHSSTKWIITMSGGTVYNCGADGIKNDSTNVYLHVAGTHIGNNVGIGVDSTVTNANVTLAGVQFAPTNIGGNYSANVASVSAVSPTMTQISSLNNVAIQAGSAGTAVIGAGATSSNCGLWLQSTSAVPGKMDSSSAGCTFSLGASSTPLFQIFSTYLTSPASPGNLFLQSTSGGSAIIGAGTAAGQCGMWFQTGIAVPGKMDGSSAGCTLSLGTQSFPYLTSNVTTYNSGSSAGVTCSGAPTGSFATVGGIVTHC